MSDELQIAPPTAEQQLADEIKRLVGDARRRVAAEAAKKRRLLANMRGDLEKHGNAEQWKRYGDLILANIGTATRLGDTVTVTDYFDDEAPQITFDGDSNRTLGEIAESYFRRYTKARNAVRITTERIEAAENDLVEIEKKYDVIANAAAAADIGYLKRLAGEKPPQPPVSKKRKAESEFKGARTFVSSDGVDILVGKRAKDNDFLTFRVARSYETWLHAADYPGSHVVIRNRKNTEPSHQTLIEAAELAAFYSDAREQPKAAVNYTLKKHVNKPKRAAHGLVSLARFKTILVEPKVGVSLKGD